MNSKPIIQSVKLPWQISYSSTSLLVKLSEDMSDLEIGIHAMLLFDEISKEYILPNSAKHGDFENISDSLGFSDVRAVIKSLGPYWLQVSPP